MQFCRPVVKIAGPRLLPPDTLELCRARPAVPRLEEHCEDEHVQDPSIPPPCTICMQFILCPFGGCKKEGDFQAQIELIFAKDCRTAVVLSPQVSHQSEPCESVVHFSPNALLE